MLLIFWTLGGCHLHARSYRLTFFLSFFLRIFFKVTNSPYEESEKEDKEKVLKLAMDEDYYLTKLWKTIKTEKRKIQVHKFIRFANVMFDIVSIKFFLLHITS